MAFTAAWIVLISIILACKGSKEFECEADSRKDTELNMNFGIARNESGDRINTFLARKESSGSSDINVDAGFRFSECRDKRIVQIRGVLIESMEEKGEERLLFHPNCGTNIAIINDGRSIIKIKDEESFNGVTVTNRPLKDNEVFEVRLDRKISKFNYGMGIGVTKLDPKTLEIPRGMYDLKNETWMIYHSNVYMNGSRIKENYIEDLKNQKVGDRLGIKRTQFGTLHVYINGVDQGPAISRVPPGVFGVYELYQDAVAATIVDPS